MKLETFFEKFDLFADAPDAVAKMRELVLGNRRCSGTSSERESADDDRAMRLLERDSPDTQLIGIKTC